MILFKKPKWLRPEINEPKYWLHLVVIAVVVLAILQYVLNYGNMLTIKNILISVPLILLGDTVAHTILKLN